MTLVKPNNTLARSSSTSFLPGGRISARYVTLSRLIINAFGIKDYQLSGGQDWLYSEHYDVDAVPQAGANPTRAESRVMLQGLLSTEFQLRLHHETKELPVYALVAGKKQAGLQPAPDRPSRGFDVSKGEITGRGVSMAELADQLSTVLNRPVVDKTGIAGVFDFALKFSLLDASTAESAPDRPDILSAIQEQLGLKMEATKAPLDVLVVDHADRPQTMKNDFSDSANQFHNCYRSSSQVLFC